jgi:hypothetical protein
MNVLYRVQKESEGIDLIMNAEGLIGYANEHIRSFFIDLETVDFNLTLDDAIGELSYDYYGNKDFTITMFTSAI